MTTRRRSIAPDAQRALMEGIDMKFRVALAAVLLATLATAAVAQPQSTTSAAASSSATPVRPVSATASATAASGGAGYRSAFEGYRRYDDQPVGSWREANDLVGRIGGWQAYSREGQGKGHDMGSMKSMPGMSIPGTESKPNGTAEKEGAGPRPKDSMKGMPGMSMPGSVSKPAAASSQKDGATGHDMGSMKSMPGKAMAGGEGAAGDDMGAMKGMPGKAMSGMSKPAGGEVMSKEGHDAMGMGKAADDSDGKSRPGRVSGTGVVQGIDRATGKVKLTHDPIAALGWPQMTMFFRLQASSLAEKVKEGDAVHFSLEKSASGYVISSLEKSPAPRETKKMK